jgi:hypothetical protein
MTREVSAQPLLALAFSEQYPNLRRAVVQRPPRARLPPPKPEPHYAQSQGVEPTSVVRWEMFQEDSDGQKFDCNLLFQGD